MVLKVIGVLGAVVLGSSADAATMQTVIQGTTGPASFDQVGILAGVNDTPNNAAGFSFTMSIVWNSEPVGIDAAASTIDQDAGTSSFKAHGVDNRDLGIESAIATLESGGTDFASILTDFEWARANDPAAGEAALSLTLRGTLPGFEEFSFTATTGRIPGILPLAFDAAFESLIFPSSGSSATLLLRGAEGEDQVNIGVILSSITTQNLDGPVDIPTEVPLPGAALLFASGLGLAGFGRWAGAVRRSH